MTDPEHFFVDCGYRDPCDRPDYEPAPAPSPDEYIEQTPICECRGDDLEQLLAFGSAIEQVLARQELQRRAGGGYQPSLLTPGFPPGGSGAGTSSAVSRTG